MFLWALRIGLGVKKILSVLTVMIFPTMERSSDRELRSIKSVQFSKRERFIFRPLGNDGYVR